MIGHCASHLLYLNNVKLNHSHLDENINKNENFDMIKCMFVHVAHLYNQLKYIYQKKSQIMNQISTLFNMPYGILPAP